VLAVLRFETPDDGFLDELVAVLRLLGARPGFRGGQVGRAYDQPDLWCLTTEWESVGAYRRALGSYDVRAGGMPVLSRALNEASAYETLASTGTAEPSGDPAGVGGAPQVFLRGSDRSIPSSA
jgi:hypothetical protein